MIKIWWETTKISSKLIFSITPVAVRLSEQLREITVEIPPKLSTLLHEKNVQIYRAICIETFERFRVDLN